MDWDTYKQLSHEPRFFTRWAIERTIEYIKDENISQAIQDSTQSNPLPKPPGHKGGVESDIFEITCDLELATTVKDLLTRCLSDSQNAKESSQRTLRGLVQKWKEHEFELRPEMR